MRMHPEDNKFAYSDYKIPVGIDEFGDPVYEGGDLCTNDSLAFWEQHSDRQPTFVQETAKGWHSIVSTVGRLEVTDGQPSVVIQTFDSYGRTNGKGHLYTLENAKELVADLQELISIIEGEE